MEELLRLLLFLLTGVVTKKAIRVAGDEMDDAIQHWFRNEHKLEIGAQTQSKLRFQLDQQ